MALKTISEFQTNSNVPIGDTNNYYYVNSVGGGSPSDEDLVDILPNLRKAQSNGYSELSEFSIDTDAGGSNDWTTFQKYRMGREAGDDYFQSGICYCFITKPNLNLSTDPSKYNSKENAYIQYICNYYPEIINSLTYSTSNVTGVPMFIPILFNNFVSTSLEDHSFMESTVAETYRGFAQRLPTTAGSSMAGGSISVSYTECQIPYITMLHKTWFDYIEKVKFGEMQPTQDSIDKKELDYTSSMYFFICAPDGETITFWGRYVGIFPSSVPYGSFSMSVGDNSILNSLSCNYMYSAKEFLQPEIFQDFNDVFNPSNNLIISDRNDTNLFEVNVDGLSGTGSGNPDGIPTRSQSVAGTTMDKRVYNSAGVYRDGKYFKLVFFDK